MRCPIRVKPCCPAVVGRSVNNFSCVRARAVPCHTMRLASSCFMALFVPIDVGSGRLNSQPVGMSVGKLCRARYWKRLLQDSAGSALRR